SQLADAVVGNAVDLAERAVERLRDVVERLEVDALEDLLVDDLVEQDGGLGRGEQRRHWRHAGRGAGRMELAAHDAAPCEWTGAGVTEARRACLTRASRSCCWMAGCSSRWARTLSRPWPILAPS